jgi:hypothetical protein
MRCNVLLDNLSVFHKVVRIGVYGEGRSKGEETHVVDFDLKNGKHILSSFPLEMRMTERFIRRGLSPPS